jgi:nitroreductase
MDTYLAIASRRDERKYAAEPLTAGTVERILDAGRLSGSSQNSQPWLFVVPEQRDRIARVATAVFVPENVLTAALVVVVVITKESAAFDAGRAAQNMLLAAWNERVSACPNGVADVDAVRAALELADGEHPRIVLSFGNPAKPRDPERLTAEEWSARANRRPLADVVRRLP